MALVLYDPDSISAVLHQTTRKIRIGIVELIICSTHSPNHSLTHSLAYCLHLLYLDGTVKREFEFQQSGTGTGSLVWPAVNTSCNDLCV
jgi:hypothetical protein